jgi:hypothetical protein
MSKKNLKKKEGFRVSVLLLLLFDPSRLYCTKVYGQFVLVLNAV